MRPVRVVFVVLTHPLRAIQPIADEHVENLFQGIKKVVLPSIKLVQIRKQALPRAVESVFNWFHCTGMSASDVA